MWDNPRLLNLAANSLIALALVLLAFAGTRMVLTSPWFPLRELTVQFLCGRPRDASRGT